MSQHITSLKPLPPGFPTRPTRVRWLIFTLACLVSWFLYLHRYSWGVVKPYVKDEFGLSNTQLGWLDSAFSITYALFQIPMGLAGDLRGPALVLPLIIFLWSLLVAGFALGQGFASFFGLRLGFGAAQAGAYPNLSKVTHSWFPLSIRTSAQGMIASFAGRTGGACASLIISTVLLGWLGLGWRLALVWLAVAGVGYAILFRLLFRNRPAEHPWVNPAEQRLIEEPIPVPETPLPQVPSTHIQTSLPQHAVEVPEESGRSLLRRPLVLLSFSFLLLHIFTSAFADQLFVYWIPQFLRNAKGLEPVDLGIFASLPLWGGALGGLAGGFLNDWLIRLTGSQRLGRQLVGLMGKLTAAVLVALSLQIEDGRSMMLVVTVAKFFTDWSQPCVWGTVTDIGGPAAGRVFGIVNTAGSIGAIVAGPIFGGILEASNWNVLFWTVVGIYIVSALCWLFIDSSKRLVGTTPAAT
jgi:sugar phosphate permease